jgi:hypothetical protein
MVGIIGLILVVCAIIGWLLATATDDPPEGWL